MTVVAVTACLALALIGCGGGGDEDKPEGKAPSKSADAPSSPGADGASPSADPTQILAQTKGEKGITVTITDATRDTGGFVTVKGTVTNNGDSAFNAAAWRGDELAVSRSGASVAGAVLVDEVGKKRYYVLRDTDGVCLCTTKLIGIKPGETRPIFAQFPAPPATTTEVEFQLPTMPPAKITLSEG
ncbi:hypothetical protein ACIP9H_09300 [Streptomyces sp. NPDC088732]|uniref:hypothetical protein n=1 Tax=Streptomyces sp. NPDC088732 TaxID=3365879 RepID=UPI00380B72DF